MSCVTCCLTAHVIGEHAFHFAAERRRLEYVAVRLLIFTLTGEELQVEYLPSGRPFFRDRRLQLSISHTFGYAAVLFSEEYEAGLDIEVFSERIVKLKERLIGPEEAAETTYEILFCIGRPKRLFLRFWMKRVLISGRI